MTFALFALCQAPIGVALNATVERAVVKDSRSSDRDGELLYVTL